MVRWRGPPYNIKFIPTLQPARYYPCTQSVIEPWNTGRHGAAPTSGVRATFRLNARKEVVLKSAKRNLAKTGFKVMLRTCTSVRTPS